MIVPELCPDDEQQPQLPEHVTAGVPLLVSLVSQSVVPLSSVSPSSSSSGKENKRTVKVMSETSFRGA